jgi:hypothetical protein
MQPFCFFHEKTRREWSTISQQKALRHTYQSQQKNNREKRSSVIIFEYYTHMRPIVRQQKQLFIRVHTNSMDSKEKSVEAICSQLRQLIADLPLDGQAEAVKPVQRLLNEVYGARAREKQEIAFRRGGKALEAQLINVYGDAKICQARTVQNGMFRMFPECKVPVAEALQLMKTSKYEQGMELVIFRGQEAYRIFTMHIPTLILDVYPHRTHFLKGRAPSSDT